MPLCPCRTPCLSTCPPSTFGPRRRPPCAVRGRSTFRKPRLQPGGTRQTLAPISTRTRGRLCGDLGARSCRSAVPASMPLGCPAASEGVLARCWPSRCRSWPLMRGWHSVSTVVNEPARCEYKFALRIHNACSNVCSFGSSSMKVCDVPRATILLRVLIHVFPGGMYLSISARIRKDWLTCGTIYVRRSRSSELIGKSNLWASQVQRLVGASPEASGPVKR